MGAHTTADDPTKYRVSAEVEEWKFRDPILRLKTYLAHEGMADEAFFARVDEEADQFAAELREGCVTMETMPGETMWDHVYAEDHPVWRRSAPPTSPTRRASRRRTDGGQLEKVTLGKSITNGLRKAMEADPKVVLIGEDIGKLGGVFRITEGLQKDFGEDRVIDSPLAESGIVGTAVGMALRGYRPVCEIQFDGFVYPAFDQIVSQVAKMHARALGAVKIPMVIRIPFGGGIGSPEHHSESPEAYFAHTAGLRVVACSNPEDAHWMIQQAVACDDPVIFFEPKRRYHDRAEYDTAATSRRGGSSRPT